jgi:hypothetical protein
MSRLDWLTACLASLGFGGGDLMKGNLIANCVRESGDHGPLSAADNPTRPRPTPACASRALSGG